MHGSHANLYADIALALYEDVSLTLVELARTHNTDRHNIERAVRLATGLTFRRFKNQIKLECAKTLLKEGLLVKEVASRMGYKSPEAFARFIKLTSGNTPQAMRL